jgi:hypothetical protein
MSARIRKGKLWQTLVPFGRSTWAKARTASQHFLFFPNILSASTGERNKGEVSNPLQQRSTIIGNSPKAHAHQLFQVAVNSELI